MAGSYAFVDTCWLTVLRTVALSTFATNKIMLLMGGFLMGIPFGAFACLGEAFASEICPMSLRGYLTGYVNICWCIGESGRAELYYHWPSRQMLEPR